MPISTAPTTLPPEALSALSRGRLIEAIKATRAATGLGLKEAKEVVEAYLAQHPGLNRQYREAAERGRGPLRWLLIAILLVGGIAAYFALTQGR